MSIKTKTLYNFYPKYFGTFDKWINEFLRIKDMGFNYLYINPIHMTGASKSDYSITDFFSFHSRYVTGEEDAPLSEELRVQGEQMFKDMIIEANKHDLDVVLDIVINHSAIDSPMITEYPDWYIFDEEGHVESPFVMDGNIKRVWDDVATINNANSPSKDKIWQFWVDMILYYSSLGVKGFRCDAVFFIPLDLWKHIIVETKKVYPDVFFVAESLGCSIEVLTSVGKIGFDYIMTSYKWWDIKKDFFFNDYIQYCKEYPSMSFTENHDTVRAYVDAHSHQRYAITRYILAAVISEMVGITSGMEYLDDKKIDLNKTTITLNRDNNRDIQHEIKQIHMFKEKYHLFMKDYPILPLRLRKKHVTMFKMFNLQEEAIFLVNNNVERSEKVTLPFDNYKQFMSISPFSKPEKMSSKDIRILPGDVLILYRKKPTVIIDSHAHIGEDNVEFNMKLTDVLESMERYDIAFSLISNVEASEFDGNLNVIDTPSQISVNQKLIDQITPHQDKVGALLWLKPHFENVTEDLKQFIKEHRHMIYGLKFHPYLSQLAPNESQMKQYLELAREFGLPIVSHTAGSPESSTKVLYEVAKENSDINFVAVHMDLGTNHEESIELISKLPNLYGDTTWVDGDSTMKAIEKCGPYKILFGTDNPIDGTNTLGKEFYQEFFDIINNRCTKEEYELLMFNNAIKLFNIK